MDMVTLAFVGAGCALAVAVVLAVLLRGRGRRVAAAEAELSDRNHQFMAVQSDLSGTQARLAATELEVQRFSAITDIESHIGHLREERAKLAADRDAFVAVDEQRRAELNAQYQEAHATYDRLRAEVASLEENLEDMSYGLYKPHYTFETSEDYKAQLDDVYERKKAMIRHETAAVGAGDWVVNNSKAEGKRMKKQAIKVMLRAFNGEVDAAVAKVTWNNVNRMEERIRKSFGAINANGTVNKIAITQEYLDLALAELRLTHEYEQKKYEEREEQRAIREQMREEERALREAERAEQEAATEEARYEKALERARAEVEKATGEKLAQANEKMAELEQKLAEAHEKMQRAKSLAELTRSGYVYVISNVGTLGDATFKIGMTRRLDPMDRVQELGDASVPFPFDVHAMIYSEDAPTLESAFHREFRLRRVNLVNMRKEYFNVTLDEIEGFARKQNVVVQFTKAAEAREYRETLALRKQQGSGAVPSNGSPGTAESPNPIPLPEKVVELFPAKLLG